MITTERPLDFNDPIEVVGCFLEKDGKFLLLQRNPEKREGGKWGNPGGKIDDIDGGDKLAAIRRELYEETGIEADTKDFEFLKTFYVLYPDGFKIMYYTYKIQLRDENEIKIQNNEHTDFVWMTPQESLGLPLMIHGDDTIKNIYGIE